MSLGHATKQQVLNALLGGTALDLSAASLTLALATAAILDTDDGTTIVRPTYTGYADISVASSDFAAATSAGLKASSSDLIFGVCTAGAGQTLIAFAVLHGTVIVLHGAISPGMVVAVTKAPRFSAGSLVAAVDAP